MPSSPEAGTLKEQATHGGCDGLVTLMLVTSSPFLDAFGMVGFLPVTSPERVGFLMGKKHFTEEQIAFALRLAESVT